MTDTRKAPRPPSDLGTSGPAFWRITAAAFELSDVEQELFRECCRLLDEAESLRLRVGDCDVLGA